MLKYSFHVLESINIEEFNRSMKNLLIQGWKPYDNLQVIYYGTKSHEKRYLQTFIYKRTWKEFIFNKN